MCGAWRGDGHRRNSAANKPISKTMQYILWNKAKTTKQSNNQTAVTFTSLTPLLPIHLPNPPFAEQHTTFTHTVRWSWYSGTLPLPLYHRHRPTGSPLVLLLVFNCRRSDVDRKCLILNRSYLLISISFGLPVQTATQFNISLLMYIYGAPCKARNFNVVYIYMDLRLATVKAVSFYLLLSVSTLNQC
jgi:hypothetical protein